MATYKAIATKFEKVNGLTDGPLKPTTTVTSGTAAKVKAAVNSAVSGVGSMAVGETVNIIVTIESDN